MRDRSLVRLRTPAGARRAPADGRDDFWALSDVSFEVRARRGRRHHRPQRRRQVHAAQDPLAHHRADRGRGRDPRPRRQPARGRHRLPPRAHRPRERLPERRDPRHEARGDRAQVRRDRRLRGGRAVPRHAGEALLERHVRAPRASPSPRTSTRTSLIVDEVLAVGDAAFQKKCLGKMGDVARRRAHGALREPQPGRAAVALRARARAPRGQDRVRRHRRRGIVYYLPRAVPAGGGRRGITSGPQGLASAPYVHRVRVVADAGEVRALFDAGARPRRGRVRGHHAPPRLRAVLLVSTQEGEPAFQSTDHLTRDASCRPGATAPPARSRQAAEPPDLPRGSRLRNPLGAGRGSAPPLRLVHRLRRRQPRLVVARGVARRRLPEPRLEDRAGLTRVTRRRAGRRPP